MTVIVTAFEETGRTVSEKTTELMVLRARNQKFPSAPSVMEAAGQRYKQTAQCLYFGGIIHEEVADLSCDFEGLMGLTWAFGGELYDNKKTARFCLA